MNLTALDFTRSIRASYWFVPSAMLVGAIGLGALMVWLDAGPAASLLDGVSWYQKSKPEGAREVLSTIAGSMITVAGVVFSITIVAISFAANQYGPRILTNFMGDRGNQITLGTFVATFTYSVVVLRTIHAGDTDFVPQLAVLVAMILALCSIAVLIYFIHHVPESIHINNVTARIGRQLIKLIGGTFPSGAEERPEGSELQERHLAQAAEALFSDPSGTEKIRSESNGYLQVVDHEKLASVASKHGLVFRLERMPGEFLYDGEVIALAAPRQLVRGDVCANARESWSIGRQRTPEQDLLFLVDELVEIAARALSTGVNDPHTANTCVDWLAAAAAKSAQGRQPSRFRVDTEGRLRVVSAPVDFRMQIDRGFGQLRPYLAGDVSAAVHALAKIASVAESCHSEDQRKNLSAEIDALGSLAMTSHRGPSLRRIEEAFQAARMALLERPLGSS